jgi:diguanylate cyclase (GGDEF)-like protein
MLVLGCFVLLSAREDVWTRADQDLGNLAVSLAREIGHNIAVYDLFLRGAQNALNLPEINSVGPELRQSALFDQAASAEGLGSLLILDKFGTIVGDSSLLTPHPLSLADRDYFTVHQAKPDVGLFVSAPFRSRLRGGDPSISISRRIDTADGQFNGAVVGTLRLAYFDTLFNRLNLGEGGSLTLFRTDGRMVTRLPKQQGDIDRTLGPLSQAQRFLRTGEATMVGVSEMDGVERLTVFHRIEGLPLVVAVAASTKTLMAAWWRRSILIAAALGILCLAVVALSWLFSRELRSRLKAEDNAIHLAEQLAAIAATDALTGLANRRAFDERLAAEWRRSVRNRTSVALLMIDADQFKLYNDRYGHPEGDRVLKGIAECMLSRTRRPGDLCSRFGGEEFTILLPETELDGALRIAEGIRAAVLALALPHADSLLGIVSVSIGVAALYPMLNESGADLVSRADAMLYDAKRAGRNRVHAVPTDEARFNRRVSQSG